MATFLQLYCTDLVDLPPIYGWLSLWMSVMELVIMTKIFITLLQLMRKNMNYEFKRLWKSLTLFFCINMASYAFNVFVFTNIRLSLHWYNRIITALFITNTP